MKNKFTWVLALLVLALVLVLAINFGFGFGKLSEGLGSADDPNPAENANAAATNANGKENSYDGDGSAQENIEQETTGTAATVSQKDGKEWLSNIEIARKVLATFDELETYSANFLIDVRENQRKRTMKGKIFYKQPSFLRYQFSKPSGNLVVSDGKIIWFYIDRLKVVGKQNLVVGKANSKIPGSNVFSDNPVSGLRRMFKKYHYHFDTLEQPRLVSTQDDKKKLSYIFSLEQRERIGGYAKLKLFVDAETLLVYRLEGDDGYGKNTVAHFFDIQTNPKLEGKLFVYKVESDVSVISNPLVDAEVRP